MPDKAETFLSDAISEAANKNTDSLNLPTTYNGSPYLLSNLHPDQKDIMLYILSKLHQWIDDYNNSTTTFMPLRLTICGQAGSGKSVLIRTLVSVLRQMFRRNDCCYVCAPTGSAAYQAGGQTIHSLFGIKSSQTSYNVTPTLQQKLLQKFANIVCLIVDERSMVCSEILATMESYASATFHCGQNHNKRWGHVPLLLFVGDDYQLPPIMPGAFEAFENHTKRSQRLCRHKRTKQQAHIAHGEHLFLQLGEDVMVLTVSKRTNDSQQHFRDILQQTRAADDQSLSHSNIELLCNLHLMSPNFTDIEREELQQDSLFLFANKAPRDAHNKHKLHAEHSPSNPVATIKARTQKKVYWCPTTHTMTPPPRLPPLSADMPRCQSLVATYTPLGVSTMAVSVKYSILFSILTLILTMETFPDTSFCVCQTIMDLHSSLKILRWCPLFPSNACATNTAVNAFLCPSHLPIPKQYTPIKVKVQAPLTKINHKILYNV